MNLRPSIKAEMKVQSSEVLKMVDVSRKYAIQAAIVRLVYLFMIMKMWA